MRGLRFAGTEPLRASRAGMRRAPVALQNASLELRVCEPYFSRIGDYWEYVNFVGNCVNLQKLRGVFCIHDDEYRKNVVTPSGITKALSENGRRIQKM